MRDRDDPMGLTDLPMQPSGSGVADLEVAFEQMRLAGADEELAAAADPVATTADERAESEAHPS